MARASTPTWLSLDRWAQIMGLDPLHFNGVFTSLRPDSACNSGEDIWLQFAYQDASKVSREDLAEAIRDAERQLANYIGYNLLPDWTIDERLKTTRPAIPGVFSSGYTNARWMSRSVTTKRGYFIAGGQRAKSVISAGAAIVRSDADGDGYQELCTVTVATSVDAEEIRVYFPSQSGADVWEIRPVTVSVSGGVATITFKIWQVPDPDLWEALNASGIDGDVAGNFITTVDVYRVYNDPQSQLQMLWEPSPGLVSCGCGSETCQVCTFAAQAGCLHTRDPRLGIVAYSAATWDSADSEFDAAELAVCRDPDRVRVWYQSGWRWEEAAQTGARASRDMDPYWEKAVAYLAIALLEREVCACNNVEHFIDHWREDLARNGREVSYQNVPGLLANPFGTTRGAWYAYQRANQEDRFIQR